MMVSVKQSIDTDSKLILKH